MARDLGLVVYPVKDVDKAISFFTELLQTEPYYTSQHYVGFKTASIEIGLDPNGHREGMAGPVAYWDVDDIESALQSLVNAGTEVQQGITDVGGGLQIARVRDADQNTIGIRQSP